MQHPVLTAKILKDIYKSIRDGNLRHSVLSQFVLVIHRLRDPSALRGEAAEAQVISELLIEVTTEEYNQLRRKHHLPLVNDQSTQQESIDDMTLIRNHGSSRLIGASAIYYYFIRFDLDWRLQEDIYAYLERPDRSVQRYANQFLDHMLSVLLQMEQEARAKDRAARCWVGLPHQASLPLASQREALKNIGQDFPQATLIKGQAQMGKTTLALSLSYQLIKDERIADVAWLDLRNKSRQSLAELVCGTLQLPVQYGYTPEQVLDGYLQVLRLEGQYLLIVLDNCDGWQSELADAWRWLSHCVVVATTTWGLMEWQGIQIDILPLSLPEARQLLEFWGKSFPNKNWLRVFDEIWKTTRGNIGALQQAFILLGKLPTSSIFSLSAVATYYAQTWRQLSDEEQTLWMLIDIWGTTTYSQIHNITPSQSQLDHALLTLLNYGFVTVQEDLTYQVLPAIRPSIAAVAGEVIRHILAHEDYFDYVILPIFECLEYFPYITDVLQKLILPAHEQVAITGKWQWWLEVCRYLAGADFLEISDRILFQFEVAIALRWLGRFHEGLAALDVILGFDIDDALRSQVLVEKSTIFFYNNQLPEALEQAQAAHACMESERSRVALLRILSRTDPQRAKAWLPQFNPQDATTFSIWAELEIKMNNYPQAAIAARRVLQLIPMHSSGYARSQCLLAQALALQGEFEESEATFVDAVKRLTHQHDIVGLARFYTNYSAAMMYAERWEDARQLSQQALGLFEKLQDTHGRQAAEENLRIIDEASRQH